MTSYIFYFSFSPKGDINDAIKNILQDYVFCVM